MEDSYENQLIVLLESAMKYNGVSYPQIAELLTPDGKEPMRQSIFRKVKTGTLKVVTLLEILDKLGVEVKLEKDGNEIPVKKACGTRVIRTVKGQKYDTKHCCAVANSFYLDGENRYYEHHAEELYFDPCTENYFIVHYVDPDGPWPKKRPWIEVIDSDAVQDRKYVYNLR